MANINSADESYSAKIKATKIFRTVICVILCIISIFPFYTMIVNATHTSAVIERGIQLIPGGNLFKNISGLLERTKDVGTNVWEALLHSCMIAAPATILQVYFATFTAS